MAQTLVRRGLAGHGQANAVLLPHTIAALARRYPERVSEDAAATAARLLAVARARVAASDAEIDACVRGGGGAPAAGGDAAGGGAGRAAGDLRRGAVGAVNCGH